MAAQAAAVSPLKELVNDGMRANAAARLVCIIGHLLVPSLHLDVIGVI
jgi:hypothetical protein